MSGARWKTRIGIVLGGLGGAVAALLGSPSRPPVPPPAVSAEQSVPTQAPTSEPPAATSGSTSTAAAPSSAVLAAATATPAPSGTPTGSAGAARPAPSASPTEITSGARAPAPLELPTSPAALVTAQVRCDRKKSYDDCSRAAEALETGSAGPPDLVQARRFRKIALTHLVAQCEVGDPHACFVIAAKHRAGVELEASAARADALEKRALQLCRIRTAPECPAP